MIQPINAASISPDALSAQEFVRRVVTSEEVAQFESAMGSAPVSGESLNIQAPEVIQPEKSIAEVVVAGVERVQDAQAARMNAIGDIIKPQDAGNTLEIRDLFSLQFELMQLSLTQDLTTKVADKLSQGVQTLFRNQ